MSIIRLRLPQTGFEKNVNAARTFVLRSEFRGEMNLVCSDEQYMQAVEKGIAQIQDGQVKKIVLSRIVSFPHQGHTAEGIFNSFNEKFPDAAVFAFTDENNAHWIGATPELLFRKRGLLFNNKSSWNPKGRNDRRMGKERNRRAASSNRIHSTGIESNRCEKYSMQRIAHAQCRLY